MITHENWNRLYYMGKDKTPIEIIIDFLQDIDYPLGYLSIVKHLNIGTSVVSVETGFFRIYKSRIETLFVIYQKKKEPQQEYITVPTFLLSPAFHINVLPNLNDSLEIQPPINYITYEAANKNSIAGLDLSKLLKLYIKYLENFLIEHFLYL